MGIPDDLTCLLRNLYAYMAKPIQYCKFKKKKKKKETCMQVRKLVRTGDGMTDWFQIGKGVRQGCILSPCLLTYRQSTS